MWSQGSCLVGRAVGVSVRREGVTGRGEEEEGEGKLELSLHPSCKGTSSLSEAQTQIETDEEKGCVYGFTCMRVWMCPLSISQWNCNSLDLLPLSWNEMCFSRQARKIGKWPSDPKPLQFTTHFAWTISTISSQPGLLVKHGKPQPTNSKQRSNTGARRQRIRRFEGPKDGG